MCSICALASMTGWEQPGLPELLFSFKLHTILWFSKLSGLVYKEKSHVFKSTQESRKYLWFPAGTYQFVTARAERSPSSLCVLTVSWSWESLAWCLWKMDHWRRLCAEACISQRVLQRWERCQLESWRSLRCEVSVVPPPPASSTESTQGALKGWYCPSVCNQMRPKSRTHV